MNKHRFHILAAELLITLNLIAPIVSDAQNQLWIAPYGSDLSDGTKEHPLATLFAAQCKVRDLRRLNKSSDSDFHILLRSGTYGLEQSLFFRAEDSGTETNQTFIVAASGENPVLSGGIQITNWSKVPKTVHGLPASAQGKIWIAETPKINGHILEFRQLWINNRKAVRARNPNGEMLARMLQWDRTNKVVWIPNTALAGLRHCSGAEMIFHQQWEIAICRLKSLQFEDDRASVRFQSPESQLQFEHPWPQPVMSTNGAPFYLANAIEFLDEPGEWFQETQTGRIYYWPRENEEMKTAEVIAPNLETLVRIEGSLDHPVEHITFEGIRFENTTWLRPSYSGHVPLQAGMFLLEAHRLSPKGTDYHSAGLDNQAWVGRPPGAISIANANHITFERCRFEHLGAAGIDISSGTSTNTIQACVFSDIAGNGIQLGKFSDPGVEVHRRYNPTDEREIATQHRIANNIITDCGNEDWGCVGITVGYGREIAIEHNEIHDLPYTGISVGWGWNKATNCMRDNRIIANHIHHVATHMCDTAGIYTLSPQPGTLIASNSVNSIRMSPYVSDPEHWFYLYLDEGSSYITVRDNWCPEDRFLRNANGPGNVWQNNGPGVSDEIRNAAGLEPGFRDLLKTK